MAATKTRKTARKGTREAGMPAERILRAKAPKQAKRPARSTKDWKDEEENEGASRSLRGPQGGHPLSPEQIVVGDNYSIGNWGAPNWLDDEGNRLTVAIWFPTQNAAIDYPEDEDELKVKRAVFKKLKVPYVGVLPGQPLQVEEARKQLRAQGARI